MCVYLLCIFHWLQTSAAGIVVACRPQLLPLLLKTVKDKTTESQLRDDAVITLSQLCGIDGAVLTTHQLTYPLLFSSYVLRFDAI